MALEHLSQLWAFENSTEWSKISFDSDSFSNNSTSEKLLFRRFRLGAFEEK